MNESPVAAVPPKPVCHCRACGAEMDAYYQKGLLPHSTGHWAVTCWQGCWMHGYTLSYPSYLTLDLTRYRKVEPLST